MKIRWSDRAEADLDAVIIYIAQDSVDAALRMQDRLMEAVLSLADLPMRGRSGLVDSTREIVVQGSPYIIVYQAEDETVWIVRIRHGAQDWPHQDPLG